MAFVVEAGDSERIYFGTLPYSYHALTFFSYHVISSAIYVSFFQHDSLSLEGLYHFPIFELIEVGQTLMYRTPFSRCSPLFFLP